MNETRVPSQEELDKLEAEISERFPGWVFTGVGGLGGREAFVSAERIGTIPDRQASMTPRGLLQAIEDRERQLESIDDTSSVVLTHEGLADTQSYDTRRR